MRTPVGRLAAIAASLAALAAACAGVPAAAQTNEAPFSIRTPPDGATVREKVHIRVPLASIPEGGYVAYYIDGQFREGLAPSEEQRHSARPNAMFDYVWNTKAPFKARLMSEAEPPKDGEHEISVRLYVPTGSTGGATQLKDTSSVKVNVANKINVGDEPIRLRYRFVDGQVRTYDRTGATSIVAGLTQGAQGTGDQEMVGQRSQLTFAVEDKYTDGDAIVRNLLDSLVVRQGGQETSYPAESLPKALYQQVTPIGEVTYQNASPSFDQFAQLGLPVSSTLEMPILPEAPVRVGDRWRSEHVSLELPGTPPAQQPHVTVDSTLDDVEWEGGYPTARIHQHYSGTPELHTAPGAATVSDTGAPAEKTITVGNIEVMNPQVTFDQDIYVAYRSGTLVKIDRKLQITGKTLQAVSTTGSAPGMGAGAPPAMMGGPMGGPPGGMGGYSQMMQGQMQSMRQNMMRGGAMGGPPGMAGYGQMMQGQMQSMRQNMMRGGGVSGAPMGGSVGGPPGSMSGYGAAMMNRMRGGGMAGAPMGYGGAGAGAGTAGQPTQITLKSTVTTELKSTTK